MDMCSDVVVKCLSKSVERFVPNSEFAIRVGVMFGDKMLDYLAHFSRKSA